MLKHQTLQVFLSKSLFLAFVLSLCSCAQKFYVKQTLDDGAIACEGETCDITYKTSATCWHSGFFSYCNPSGSGYQPLLVHIDKIEGIEYYDGLVFKVPRKVKSKQSGVYKYTTNEGLKKTVPHITFVK